MFLVWQFRIMHSTVERRSRKPPGSGGNGRISAFQAAPFPEDKASLMTCPDMLSGVSYCIRWCASPIDLYRAYLTECDGCCSRL